MLNYKSFIINSRGFTLIEILMVIAIMSILLGISFVGYKERGEELELQRAAFKVMADIERVRGMAMSAQEDDTSGQIPEGGWGIHFNPSSPNKYIIFADKDLPINYTYAPITEGPGQEIVLKEGVVLDIPVSINIVFFPPSPDVYLQGGDLIDEINIVIALTNKPLKTKTIIVNRAGLITISN